MDTGSWLLAAGYRLLALGALSISAAFGAETDRFASVQAHEVETNVQRAIEESQAAFVFIGGGSGVCISPDGYVFTNHHVVQRHSTWNVRVFGTGQFHVADVVGLDPLGDVALLKIRNGRNLPCATFSDVSHLRTGQLVLALGDPYKLSDVEGPPSASLGTLCALHRYQNDPRAPAASFFADALQTDAAVNPGSSGGPLFDLNGRLLGITGQIMSRFGGKANSGIAYAVPADQLARFLPLLQKANGTPVHHATIPAGLNLEWSTANLLPSPAPPTQSDTPAPDATPAGTVIESVEAGSAADRAGFRTRDRIVKADGETVTGPHRLLGILQSRPEETSVEFEILRGKEQLKLTTVLPRF